MPVLENLYNLVLPYARNIFLSLVVAVLAWTSYLDTKNAQEMPDSSQTATSTKVSGVASTTIGIGQTGVATSSTATTTKTASVATAKKAKKITIPTTTKPQTTSPLGTGSATIPGQTVTQTTPPSATSTQPVQPTELLLSFDTINVNTRASLVNILCTTKAGGSFNPITGSGIIIDSKGVVFTNSHVAQYFLLKDYLEKDFVECVIRTGSPAQPTYYAEPIFISPAWIEQNAAKITDSSPTGTGEDDFALLRITGRTDGSLLPASFPALAYDSDAGIDLPGLNVLLAGYPAGFLGGIAIQQNLYVTSSITLIKDIYTFHSNTPDLISIGGTPLSQRGASGGAVVTQNGKLVGIIATASTEADTGVRELRAITISHIERSLIKQTSQSLASLLAGDLAQRAANFAANTAPHLTQLLTGQINSTQGN